MAIETIVAAIIAIAPSIASIIGVIAAVVKMIKAGKDSNKDMVNKFETSAADMVNKFEEVKREVVNVKQFEALKDQLLIAHQENREIKRQLNELLTKIDKVARED